MEQTNDYSTAADSDSVSTQTPAQLDPQQRPFIINVIHQAYGGKAPPILGQEIETMPDQLLMNVYHKVLKMIQEQRAQQQPMSQDVV